MHTGYELKKLRLQEELTQTELAESLGTTQPNISLIESRKSHSTKTIEWYLLGLGLDLAGFRTRIKK